MNLSTQERMMVQAYGIYLVEEHGLEFSTRDKYKRQLRKHFAKPDQQESTPPHFEDARQKLSDYTS